MGSETFMKISKFKTMLLMLSIALMAQSSILLIAAPFEQELGKWWKNSEVVRKLQLSEEQIDYLEQTFLHYSSTLANLNAELKSREADLKILMNADPIDESRIMNQTEAIAVSRAALEKANSSMMIAFRKNLTKDQWNKLQEIRDLRQSLIFPPAPSGGPAKVISEQNGEKIYASGGPVSVPKMVYSPMPRYTEEAKKAKIQGVVMLQVILRKDGSVDSFKVLRGLGYGLDESAINTLATQWRFEPATLNGQPVSVQATIEVSFRLY
jgi:TonB family protein